MRNKLLASALLAVFVSFAAPVAAHADIYVPQGGCTVDPLSVHAGSSSTLTCTPGTFTPSEKITYTVSGCDQPMVTLDGVRAQPLVKTALTSGASALVVGVPTTATGVCTVKGVAASRTVTASITVVPLVHTAAVQARPAVLAKTGQDAPFLLGGLGALAVAVGAAFLLIARRRRIHD
jgi:LPXTG-motif cell wall-anchored protein